MRMKSLRLASTLITLSACAEEPGGTPDQVEHVDPVQAILSAAQRGDHALAERMFDEFVEDGVFDVAYLMDLYWQLPSPEFDALARRTFKVAVDLCEDRPDIAERFRSLRDFRASRQATPDDVSQGFIGPLPVDEHQILDGQTSGH